MGLSLDSPPLLQVCPTSDSCIFSARPLRKSRRAPLGDVVFGFTRGDVSNMDLRSELLKSIWYAFTSLDVEKCGKVSKSQLKVRSSVLKIRKRRSLTHRDVQGHTERL